jgi:hypothetical protein
MEDLILELKAIGENRKLSFSEKFYRSEDGKTIMGEVPFKQFLFIDYRETEAGSNPREYTGLKKTNKTVLMSLLAHNKMFRFLHSGIIVSLTDTQILDDYVIAYGDCCLTNGNQTRFLLLIITLLKLFAEEKKLSTITAKEFNTFIQHKFGDSSRIKALLQRIKYSRVFEIVNFLNHNTKYLTHFNEATLSALLNSLLRIQVNLIDPIVTDLEDKTDEYSVGTLIAEANNDTQNVRTDDIFGNKYKSELDKYIFKDFLTKYGNRVRIEYRMGEIIDKGDKVHILTLLRPIVATGILTKEKTIFEYTNQRAPVYKLFESLLRSKDKAGKTIGIISQLAPLLYDIRKTYVEPILELQRKSFLREYKGKAISGDLDRTIIEKAITSAGADENQIEEIIKPYINYNIEHIFPVLVYRIRKLFRVEDRVHAVTFAVPKDKEPEFFKALVEVIYKKYIETKLRGLPSSLTDFVRSDDFYASGEEAYTVFKQSFRLEESDFIEKHRYLTVYPK